MTRRRSRSTRKPHAQIHLPELTAQEALLFVHLLERVCRAIWRAHGDGMARLLKHHVDSLLANSSPSGLSQNQISQKPPDTPCDNVDFPF